MTVKKKPVFNLEESIKEDRKINKPFLEKGHVFEVETNSKWLINFDKIPELINIELSFYWAKYENWFNWKFNNECICPFMFIGEKDYPIYLKGGIKA